MAAQHPAKTILIAGAGLAGLALAQGFRRANPSIPFRIFERDSTASFRAQGYRIRISPQGAEALRRLLPDHLWTAFEATCAPVMHDGGHRVEALTGEPASWGPPPPHTQGGQSYNADRVVLRTLLMSGLEGHISFGKRFESYSTGDSGEVEARFEDGTTERGAMLVGADGVRSRVRRHLLPNYIVLDTEGRAVFGKTTLTPDLRARIPKELERGITLAGESKDNRIKLFCDIMKFNRDLNAAQETDGPRFDLPADYIYWVLVFRQDILGSDSGADDLRDSLLAMSNAQSAELALKLTKRWHPTIRAVLESQDLDETSILPFYAASGGYSGAEWEELRANTKGPASVALVGDAGHPMPPVGGIGANVAFQEAADLCSALTSVYIYGADQTQKIVAYEQQMIDRAKEAISRAGQGAGHFFGMRPPAELKPVTL